MTFKSYAEGGQFGTYYIDLPIKTEINEDLRAASNFAEQMKLSQQYREKWANSYLSALNEKSAVERQNRDDNFEFLQNNYKSIYEGEQREFEGRLAELRREQTKNAAEPSTIEKVFGFMQAALQVAGTVEGLINQQQAAQLEESKEAATISLEKMSASGWKVTGANIKELNRILTTGTDQGSALEAIRAKFPSLQAVGDADIINIANASGELALHNQLNAWRQYGAPWQRQQLEAAIEAGSGHKLDSSLPQNLNGANGYNERQRQFMRAKRVEFLGPDVSDELLHGVIIPYETKLFNSVAARNSQVWGKQNAAKLNQLALDRINYVEATDNPAQYLDNIFNKQIEVFGGDVAATAQWMFDKVTDPGSTLTPATYETWLNKRINSSVHPPGGPVQLKLRSALTNLQEKGFESVRRLNQINKAQETQKLLEFDAYFREANAAGRKDLQENILTTNWSGTSADFQKKVMYLATPQGQQKYTSPTWSEITGVTDDKLGKSVDTYMLGRVSTGAYFDKHGKTEAIADNNYQLARGLIIAEAKRLWVETQKNFPEHAGNKDIILQKAIGQAVENLLDGPAPKLSLDNVNLKDPVKPIRFNVSKAFQNRTTADFYNDIEPFKETKTIPKGQFPELTGRDGSMIDRFNVIRSRTMGGPVAIEHVMAVANSQWATELSEVLGITKFEAIDKGLRSRGHKGLDKANMVTSEQAGIHDRYVADLVDGAKKINLTSLQVRAEALKGTLGSTPAPYVRQPVQAIIGSDVISQGIGAWRDGKHEDHNHYAFESTEHRDQAADWVKSEYKRRWGNEYLLNRNELEINHHEDRQGSSHHGAQGGHRASDVPRHNFVYGEGETIGANRVHQLYAEWFKGAGQ